MNHLQTTGLTATTEGQKLLHQCPDIINALRKLTEDSSETVAKESLLCLVNLSAEEAGASFLMQTIPNLVELCAERILDENSSLADPWAMLLSNTSRPEKLAAQVFDRIENSIDRLVNAFTRIDYNTKKCHLNYLGPIFSNIAQVAKGRDFFCRPKSDILSRILPFVHYEHSVVRLGGSVGLLKNICFDSSRHEYLLEQIDVLPIILLPLTGPEAYSDEENDRLPIELQYLGPDKKREADPDIRKMLLESLAQLCATRKAREFLRSKGTYEVLRELHKFECTEDGDPSVLLACENVVDILIRTEDEIGEDNLKSLDIPNDVLDKFNTMDSNLVE